MIFRNDTYFGFKKPASTRPKYDRVLIPVVIIVLAIIASVAASTGSIKLVALGVFAVIGCGMFFYPGILLWSATGLGLVGAGLARLYTPSLQQIRWLVIPIIFGLLLYVLNEYLRVKREPKNTDTPSIVIWSVFFILLTMISALVNQTDFKSMVIGLKGYFQVWGLLFAIGYISWPKATITQLPKIFLGVALLQLPFVLHQYIFIVPQRVGLSDGIVAVDVVAGTFGADRFGGGMNAVLSTYLFITFAGLLGLYRENVLSGFRLVILSAILLFPVFVNSAKISVFYFLAIGLILYGDYIIKKPLKFIGVCFAAMLVLTAMLASFIKHSPNSDVSSVAELIAFTYEYNVGNDETFDGKLSRGGAIQYWIDEHGLKDVFGTVLGHGVGISRVETDSRTVLETGINSDLGIGRISIVAVLWESGMLGLICLLALLVAAYNTAARLEKHFHDEPWHVGIFAGIKAAMGVIFVSLWHKNFLVYQIGYQTMFVLILGYLVYWERVTMGQIEFEKKTTVPGQQTDPDPATMPAKTS